MAFSGDIEAAASGNGGPHSGIADFNFAGAMGNIHPFWDSGVEFVFAGKDHSQGFSLALAGDHGVGDHFTLEINIGFGQNCR